MPARLCCLWNLWPLVSVADAAPPVMVEATAAATAASSTDSPPVLPRELQDRAILEVECLEQRSGTRPACKSDTQTYHGCDVVKKRLCGRGDLGGPGKFLPLFNRPLNPIDVRTLVPPARPQSVPTLSMSAVRTLWGDLMGDGLSFPYS